MFPAYASFLQNFSSAGYKTVPMTPEMPPEPSRLYLRHDIDFDAIYAVRTAEIEAEMGITATYFFMLTSNSYNPLSKSNAEAIQRVKSLGHKISVHFDPTAYEDYKAGLAWEAGAFEKRFGVPCDVVSLHRPTEFFLNHDSDIGGIYHTYQKRFSKDIFYCSDSQGRWRFGSPLDSEAFKTRRAIHLLIHPIWWVRREEGPQAILDAYVTERIGRFLIHIQDNCLTYDAAKSSHAVRATE